ncbi:MAG: BspA family leucine-rich repeat surface protein [Oscillospiraceae bacterium]|nr:BspA family leucine-rich repeat surface protein [Oscillospiraceae bacterium]
MKRRIPVLMMAALLLTGCGNAGGSTDGNGGSPAAEQSAEKPGKKPSLFGKSNVSLDEGTGVLTLSGNLTAEEVQAYKSNDSVKSVVCKSGTVFPEDSSNLFREFDCESIDLTNADTSQVKNMSSMFLYCNYMTSLNLGGIDTSKVEEMDGMFSGCDELLSLDITGLNTDSVTDIREMFYDCQKLTELDLSNFTCPNVRSYNMLFCNCYRLKSLDLSAMNLAKASDMSQMFSGCSSLKELNLGTDEIENVAFTTYMFENCHSLEMLDLTKFHIENVAFMPSMFTGCENLTTILVSYPWNPDHGKGSSNVFYGCEKLVGGNGTAYDPEHTDWTYACVDTPETPGYLTLAE